MSKHAGEYIRPFIEGKISPLMFSELQTPGTDIASMLMDVMKNVIKDGDEVDAYTIMKKCRDQKLLALYMEYAHEIMKQESGMREQVYKKTMAADFEKPETKEQKELRLKAQAGFICALRNDSSDEEKRLAYNEWLLEYQK